MFGEIAHANVGLVQTTLEYQSAGPVYRHLGKPSYTAVVLDSISGKGGRRNRRSSGNFRKHRDKVCRESL